MRAGKTKLAFFQYDLGVGGVQRSLVSLLNNIDHTKYDVDLYIVDDNNFFNSSIPENVKIIKVDKLPFFAKVLPFYVVRKLFSAKFTGKQQYDVAIDFNSYQHITALGALTVAAKKRVLWMHGDNEKRLKVDNAYRFAYLLQKSKIQKFDTLAVVSEGLLESAQRLTGFPGSRIKVVNNFINTEEIIERSKQPIDIEVNNNNFNLVSVSRLAYEKGIDIMLEVVKKAALKRPDLKLYIIGDGPERKKVESLIGEYKLQDNVILLGAKSNPYPYMKLMDGFISTSRHEGQGINILEAKTLGLQIFIPKHLEKFSYEVKGSDDLVKDIISASKTWDKKLNRLAAYNKQVLGSLDSLFLVGKHGI